ncbi:hypothetical protein [Streptomyces sp. NK15101]|uniref:hypothetical protein n=1 Tax=Streptomyces sp. NK15101 TaxID=2873261 RepID=UPI001CEC38B4|nr:hypothetical protein [Streptomyces sp. NK15101]
MTTRRRSGTPAVPTAVPGAWMALAAPAVLAAPAAVVVSAAWVAAASPAGPPALAANALTGDSAG